MSVIDNNVIDLEELKLTKEEQEAYELAQKMMDEKGIIKGGDGYSVNDIEFFMLQYILNLEEGEEKQKLVEEYEKETGKSFPKMSYNTDGTMNADFNYDFPPPPKLVRQDAFENTITRKNMKIK